MSSVPVVPKFGTGWPERPPVRKPDHVLALERLENERIPALDKCEEWIEAQPNSRSMTPIEPSDGVVFSDNCMDHMRQIKRHRVSKAPIGAFSVSTERLTTPTEGQMRYYESCVDTIELLEEEMDKMTDDNRYEASEVIEFQDKSWTIALNINSTSKEGGDWVELLVYSYRKGIDRITVSNAQFTKDIKVTSLIKYRYVNGSIEILPIYSAMSTGLINMKLRYNKGIELKLYALANWVDMMDDDIRMNVSSVIWSDAIGTITVKPAERSNFRRKVMFEEEKLFAPLRMLFLTVKADFTMNVTTGSSLKWQIMSIQPLLEEVEAEGKSLSRNLWPARMMRFDDMVMRHLKFGTQEEGFWFSSITYPDLYVYAPEEMRGLIYSIGDEYARKGVMTAVIHPVFKNDDLVHYQAHIVGPLKIVMALAEGRLANYTPKTWPPKIQAMVEKYKAMHNEKALPNRKPAETPKMGPKPANKYSHFYIDRPTMEYWLEDKEPKDKEKTEKTTFTEFEWPEHLKSGKGSIEYY